MSNENPRPSSPKKQLIFAMLVVGSLFGAYAIWEKIFPPEMTAQCAYYIEKFPPEDFSFIQASQRDETMKCLFIKWKYNQKTWKVSDDYIVK